MQNILNLYRVGQKKREFLKSCSIGKPAELVEMWKWNPSVQKCQLISNHVTFGSVKKFMYHEGILQKWCESD